jgi:hypothetical protein
MAHQSPNEIAEDLENAETVTVGEGGLISTAGDESGEGRQVKPNRWA